MDLKDLKEEREKEVKAMRARWARGGSAGKSYCHSIWMSTLLCPFWGNTGSSIAGAVWAVGGVGNGRRWGSSRLRIFAGKLCGRMKCCFMRSRWFACEQNGLIAQELLKRQKKFHFLSIDNFNQFCELHLLFYLFVVSLFRDDLYMIKIFLYSKIVSYFHYCSWNHPVISFAVIFSF